MSMTLTWIQLEEYTQVSARKNTSWQITHRRVQSAGGKGSDVWRQSRVILKLASTLNCDLPTFSTAPTLSNSDSSVCKFISHSTNC
jgi:hypothetical protein